MPVFCSVCVSDEYTSEEVNEDGRVFIVCANTRQHGDAGYTWEPTPERKGRNRGDGLGAELDIWDKLLECVPADGATHAYGSVEDVFFERFPVEAALLQERYGHRWRDGKKSTNQYSMSVYIAARLDDLSKEGLLIKDWGPAEGPWSYNGIISHWSRH